MPSADSYYLWLNHRIVFLFFLLLFSYGAEIFVGMHNIPTHLSIRYRTSSVSFFPFSLVVGILPCCCCYCFTSYKLFHILDSPNQFLWGEKSCTEFWRVYFLVSPEEYFISEYITITSQPSMLHHFCCICHNLSSFVGEDSREATGCLELCIAALTYQHLLPLCFKPNLNQGHLRQPVAE